MRMQFRRFLLPLVILAAPLAAEDNLKYGQPACGGPVLDKKYFVVCYDAERKDPVWVGYALTKDAANTKVTSRQGSFKPDAAIPRGQRAQNADYAGSGYDKGHMAPANDFSNSVAAMRSTFVLSNAVPQRHGVNAGMWRDLEASVHDLAAKRGTVWVVSGPVFAGKTAIRKIGPDKVSVPSHTYKVVLCVHSDGAKEMFGFVVPNVEKPAAKIGSYTFSVNEVEKLTGLDFFSALPAAEQNRLERASKPLPVL